MDAPKGIKITIEQVPTQKINCWRITPEGYLDADTAGQLMDKSMGLTCRESAQIIMDLKEVIFMDSVGWSALLHIARALSRNKGKFVIINMIPSVERMYRLLKLEPTLPSFPTEDEALRYLG